MTYPRPTSYFGNLPVEVIRGSLSAEHWARLFQHAICLACLDGNSYPEVLEQYVPDAYTNLWMNSGGLDLTNLPNLYPCDVVEAGMASLMPSHPQYGEMTSERRNEILDLFLVDPRGNPIFVQAIIDKAAAVLGSVTAATDWIDQYSATLGEYPRCLAATRKGTDEVLRHLTTVSQHGHDA
jgi:hypothetical protein